MEENNDDIIVIPEGALKDNNTLWYDENNPKQGTKEFAKINKKTGEVILFIRDGTWRADSKEERSFIKISYTDKSLIGRKNPPKDITELIKDKEVSSFYLYQGSNNKDYYVYNINATKKIIDIHSHMVDKCNGDNHFIYPICSYLVLIGEYKKCLDTVGLTIWTRKYLKQKQEILDKIYNEMATKIQTLDEEKKQLKEEKQKGLLYKKKEKGFLSIFSCCTCGLDSVTEKENEINHIS